MERAEGCRVHIEWALGNRDRRGAPISFSGAAEKLNEQHLPAPMGAVGVVERSATSLAAWGFLWPLCRPNCWKFASKGSLKQHPGWIAQERISKLGSNTRRYRERVSYGTRFVCILSDCFQAATCLNAEQRRVGRRFYHSSRTGDRRAEQCFVMVLLGSAYCSAKLIFINAYNIFSK